MSEVKHDDAKYFAYLVQLRDSGVTNMWGAAPYIAQEFDIPAEEAKDVWLRWIKSFDKEGGDE